MRVLIGTSGWQYDSWRGTFTPPDLPVARWLEHYTEHFPTVELNSTFYRLPSAETFAGWAERVPPDFCFAVKASRFLTHVKRLRDPAEPVQRLLERCSKLGSHLGPVLVQLPPRFHCDLPRLEETLAAFGSSVRVAVEFRDDSWHTDAVFDLLHRFGAALCWWDRSGEHGPLVRTADWAYLRLHAGRGSPEPCYETRERRRWLGRLVPTWPAGSDAYVYFNNDARAVRGARRPPAHGAGRADRQVRGRPRAPVTVPDVTRAAP